jgi:hypothetical protein
MLASDLRRLGVHLRADGDKLHIDAPKGILTKYLRKELSLNKPELLKILRSENASGDIRNHRVIDGHRVKKIMWETRKAIVFEDSEGKFYRYLQAYSRSWPVILVPGNSKKGEITNS